MAGEYLTFDVASGGPNGENTGTALNIGPGTDYRLREWAAPAPPQSVIYAGSVDTEGGLPSSRKHENRVITLKIMCDTAAALRSLQDKIGKVAREGGTLKWTLPNAETVIFDLLTADTFEPEFRVTFYRDVGRYCDVAITLVAAPYGRGPAVTLSDHSETTLPVLTFTETGIKGDMPALGELIVDNDVASPQLTLICGIQSKEYDATSSAGLFFEAEGTAMIDAVAAVGPAGASGAGANKVASHTLTSQTALNIVSGGHTSAGVFRMFARVQVPATNTGTVTTWLEYTLAGGPAVPNPSVEINPAQEGVWLIIDLGEVRVPRVSKGTHKWTSTLMVNGTVGADKIFYDYFLMMPIAERYGVLSGDPNGVAGIGDGVRASESAVLRWDSALTGSTGTGLWGAPIRYEGDYLLIPPAGAEARTLRVIAKFSRGVFYTSGSAVAAGTRQDSAIDDLSARLTYQPRYLVVPSP